MGGLAFDVNAGRQLQCRVRFRGNRSIHQSQFAYAEKLNMADFLSQNWLINRRKVLRGRGVGIAVSRLRTVARC